MQTIPFDDGGDFPTLEAARAYVQGNTTTNPAYHADRLRALKHLLSKVEARNIIDFGCGDGMYFKQFFKPSSIERIVGVDISRHMITLAEENLSSFAFDGRVGGVDSLAEIEGRFDLALAIDVLGYLDESALDRFYRSMSLLVRPGGHLIVMYGNELFDMFALNSGTSAFFSKHFGLDVAELLTEGKARRPQNAIRKNPLSFGAEIAPYGFTEIAQAYSQWHRIPPGIGNRKADLPQARLEMRDHSFDPNSLSPVERWKSLFRSSIFASLLVRA